MFWRMAMWEAGIVTVSGKMYSYQAKVYDTGSPMGIDGGRVSKLSIPSLRINYDRGWDGKDMTSHPAVSAILMRFPSVLA